MSKEAGERRSRPNEPLEPFYEFSFLSKDDQEQGEMIKSTFQKNQTLSEKKTGKRHPAKTTRTCS